MSPPVGVAARLVERARETPEKTALIEGRGSRRRALSFGELADRVARVAGRLRRKGVGPGDRVLVHVPRSADLYIALLGVLHDGAAAILVEPGSGRRGLEPALAATRPSAMIAGGAAPLLGPVHPTLRRVPVRLWSGPGPFGLATPRGTGIPVEAVAPTDTALITFAPGPSGGHAPRVRSHGVLAAQGALLGRVRDVSPEEVDMPAHPVAVLANLATGVTTVLPDSDPGTGALDPSAVLAQMRAEGVSTTSGPAGLYAALAGHLRRAEPGQGPGVIPVRALVATGPMFPRRAERLAAATAGKVGVVYEGRDSEPVAVASAQEVAAASREPGAQGLCIGRPLPGVGWKLVRPDASGPSGGGLAEEVDPGEAGELLIAGDHVAREALDADGPDGGGALRDDGRAWYGTGDGARFDGERLWLLGRVSRRVERFGRTWWNLVAETRALSVPGVTRAAYLGVQGPGGTRTVLCVELKGAGGSPSRRSAELNERLREALEPVPVDTVRIMTFPRGPWHASVADVPKLRAQLGAHVAG